MYGTVLLDCRLSYAEIDIWDNGIREGGQTSALGCYNVREANRRHDAAVICLIYEYFICRARLAFKDIAGGIAGKFRKEQMNSLGNLIFVRKTDYHMRICEVD